MCGWSNSTSAATSAGTLGGVAIVVVRRRPFFFSLTPPRPLSMNARIASTESGSSSSSPSASSTNVPSSTKAQAASHAEAPRPDIVKCFAVGWPDAIDLARSEGRGAP